MNPPTIASSPSTWSLGPSHLLLLVVVLAAGLPVIPAVCEVLQYDRPAIAAGQAWRLVTCNFVHYSLTHMACNVAAFAVLAWTSHARSRRTLWVALAGFAVIGPSIWLASPHVGIYRGISGVSFALLGWALALMALGDRGRRAWLCAAALAALAAKTAFELAGGCVLLPTSAPPGVVVVHVTHAVGLAVGLAAALLNRPAGDAATSSSSM